MISTKKLTTSILIISFALLLNFGVRYFYVFHYAGLKETVQGIGGDAADYLQIAYTLSKTGQYARPLNLDVKRSLLENRHPDVISGDRDAWRPPIWPVILSSFLRVSNYNIKVVFYLRFLLDSITLLLFYRLLLYLNLQWIIRTSALLVFALHPTWLYYSATLLSEPLTLLIHIAFTLSLFGFLQNPKSNVRIATMAILSGLCILQHPYYLFFPFFTIASLYLTKNINLSKAIVILLGTCFAVSPWVTRNMLLFSTIQPVLTTSSGPSMAQGWNSEFLCKYRNNTAGGGALNEWADLEGPPPIGSLSQLERYNLETKLAINFIGTHWPLVPAIVTRKLVGAITPFPEVSKNYGFLEKGRILLQIVSFVPFLIVLFLGSPGTVRTIAASVFFAYVTMGVITYPELRYRFPLIWIELLCVCITADYFLRYFKRPQKQ